MDNVIIIMEELEPNLHILYTDKQISYMVQIASVIVGASGLDDEYVDLGTALVALDLLVTPDRDNITSQRIGAVSETYSNHNNGISKWQAMYDSLLTGTLDSEISLVYVGIGE